MQDALLIGNFEIDIDFASTIDALEAIPEAARFQQWKIMSHARVPL
jgi:hypothetical protein